MLHGLIIKEKYLFDDREGHFWDVRKGKYTYIIRGKPRNKEGVARFGVKVPETPKVCVRILVACRG